LSDSRKEEGVVEKKKGSKIGRRDSPNKEILAKEIDISKSVIDYKEDNEKKTRSNTV